MAKKQKKKREYRCEKLKGEMVSRCEALYLQGKISMEELKYRVAVANFLCEIHFKLSVAYEVAFIIIGIVVGHILGKILF